MVAFSFSLSHPPSGIMFGLNFANYSILSIGTGPFFGARSARCLASIASSTEFVKYANDVMFRFLAIKAFMTGTISF
ncbi:hypothetical protein BH10PLA2_BH10PLA2_11750 [soil metagenome]